MRRKKSEKKKRQSKREKGTAKRSQVVKKRGGKAGYAGLGTGRGGNGVGPAGRWQQAAGQGQWKGYSGPTAKEGPRKEVRIKPKNRLRGRKSEEKVEAELSTKSAGPSTISRLKAEH